MLNRKIIPVTPDRNGRIIARKPVHAVFDSSRDGTLVEVAYRQNPMDSVEVLLTNMPAGQVYVEIHE